MGHWEGMALCLAVPNWLIHKQPFPNKLDLFPVSVFFWLASKFCAYEILVSHQSGLKSLALVRYV